LRKRLLTAFTLVAALCAVLGPAAAPALADQVTLTLTLLDGSHVTVTEDVAPGTPADQAPIPAEPSPVINVQVDSDAPSAPAGSGATGPTGSTSSSGPVVGTSKPQQTTGHHGGGNGTPAASTKPATTPAAQGATGATGTTGTSAAPTGSTAAINPAIAASLLGTASGPNVPDFFIQDFRIPPFLLSIYQAAGIEYDVPWQVLAAINEVETDYGRNLSVSSAGAVGWMQFMPDTWKLYGVDATNSGVKDPFNPVDAIFAAARYLHAAGASQDLSGAIFSYNHADWYVQSVLMRAKLIGALPDDLVGSITGLTQGFFPVSAAAHYKEGTPVPTHGAKQPGVTSTSVFSRSGAAVIAVQDGQIVGLGTSTKLGKYVKLRDVYGNTYTYGNLKMIQSEYLAPKQQTETQAQIASELQLPSTPASDPVPTVAASAGHQAVAGVGDAGATVGTGAAPLAAGPLVATDVSDPQQRLFAHPTMAAAYAAGGKAQLSQAPVDVSAYTTQPYGLNPNDVQLSPLKLGSTVTAGTVLGRIGYVGGSAAPSLLFQIRPAGKGAPLIDPKPILDGWKLLQNSAVYRAADPKPYFGPNVQPPTIGQVLLESKTQLEQRVLSDPRVRIYACGRHDVETGQIDRRVLGVVEYLAANNLYPTVTGLRCGHTTSSPADDGAQYAAGVAVDIAAVNGTPVQGNQSAGQVVDTLIRRLLTLQGIYKPYQIISLLQYPNAPSTVKLPDHANHVTVAFQPQYNPSTKLGAEVAAALAPQQWTQLAAHLAQIADPTVSSTPSQYAIPDTSH
jgi:hypothetical protein